MRCVAVDSEGRGRATGHPWNVGQFWRRDDEGKMEVRSEKEVVFIYTLTCNYRR
jgi:hypothetical protein